MFAISTVDKNGIRTVAYKTENREEALQKYAEIFDGLPRNDFGQVFDESGKEIVWVVCEDVHDAGLLAEKYPGTKAGALLHATRTYIPQ